MQTTKKVSLKQKKWAQFFACMLLLTAFYLPAHVHAETAIKNITSPASKIPVQHVFIISSLHNKLHSSISNKLLAKLKIQNPNTIVSIVSSEGEIKTTNDSNNIIVSIGSEGELNEEKINSNKKRLYILTSPKKHLENKNSRGAILYMTQSYCRQVAFIKQLNTSWKTISILTSQKENDHTKALELCAKEYNIKLYTVHTNSKNNLTNDIKDALNNSDVLLALPDKNIYNSRTVKNILLTSYRYRKPVIAFSKNFVSAGALAAIHSNMEQIILSASNLIEKQLNSDATLPSTINYPDHFDIDINRQVFKALNLTIPNTTKLKNSLMKNPEAAL